jgi:hypothetical protein
MERSHGNSAPPSTWASSPPAAHAADNASGPSKAREPFELAGSDARRSWHARSVPPPVDIIKGRVPFSYHSGGFPWPTGHIHAPTINGPAGGALGGGLLLTIGVIVVVAL